MLSNDAVILEDDGIAIGCRWINLQRIGGGDCVAGLVVGPRIFIRNARCTDVAICSWMAKMSVRSPSYRSDHR